MDRTVRRWDAATGRQTALVLSELRGQVRDLRVAPGGEVYADSDANYFFSEQGEDRQTHLSTVHRWDPATGKAARFLKGQKAVISFMELSPDGRRLLLLRTNRELEYRPGARNQFEFQTTFSNKPADVVTVWDTGTGERLCALPPPESYQEAPRPRFSPDGATVVYLTERSDELALYDARTGRRVRALAIPEWGQGVPKASGARGPQWEEVQFSPDGRIVIGRRSAERLVWFWDAATGGLRGSYAPRDGSLAGAFSRQHLLAFSPDSKRLALVADRAVQVVDVETRTAVRLLTGHEARVTALAYSPDGTRLLTGSEDKTAALWDVETGRLLTVYRGHAGAVNLLAYSPDGTRVATASGAEPLARVWPVDIVPAFEKRKPRELTAAERVRYELPATSPAK
jgi:WD40 repeat protein